MRLNPVVAHLFLSVSEEGSFMWIEGGAVYCAFQFDKEGLTHTHTTLRNKDLSERIRYSSIPESSNQITWILGRIRKRRNF